MDKTTTSSQVPSSFSSLQRQEQQEQTASTLSSEQQTFSSSSSSSFPSPSSCSSTSCSSSSSSSCSSYFKTLPNLPTRLGWSQCVWFNKELLICGGEDSGVCYSYHIYKEQYKLICKYPKQVSGSLYGHVVIPCDTLSNINIINNKNKNKNKKEKREEEEEENIKNKINQITLLSFGGQGREQDKYTLVMKYQSVWNYDHNHDYNHDHDQNQNQNQKNKNNKEINLKHHKNKWNTIPNINIGSGEDDLCHVRALIGGSRNQLLFIIYPLDNLAILDFESFQTIHKHVLPLSIHIGTCFVKMFDIDGYRNNHIVVCQNNGWLLTYDEEKYTLNYERLPKGPGTEAIYYYSYVHWKDFIIFFGGFRTLRGPIDEVHVYSTKKKEWKQCLYKLPANFSEGFAILDQENNWVHLLGGYGEEWPNPHWKIRMIDLIGLPLHEIEAIVEYWVRENKLGMGWIVEFHIIIAHYLNSIE